MAGEPADARGLARHHPCDIAPRDQPGVDHRLLHDPQRALEPDHAVRGRVPLARLRLGRMRCVVGRDDVDRAVGETLAHGEHVLLAPQRRVDLEARVVAAGEVVGQQQVVRSDLGGDVDAATLRPPDDLDRSCRRQVADVQAGADVLGEQHVARDDRLLGDGGPAGETELGRDGALVHLRALGEPRVLCVLGDDAVERLHVLERSPHDQRIPDAEPVVAEDAHPGARVGHRAELGEPLALLADGHRADGLHRDEAGGLAEGELLLDDAGGVGDGRRVGHREHGRVPAGGGGAGSGEDRLGRLVPGLAQVRVQVDETRKHDEPVGIDDGRAGAAEAGADLGDHAVGDEQVGGAGAFEACSAEEENLAHRASSPSVRSVVVSSSRLRTGQQQVERGHAHRDAVRDLLEHRRAGRIRGFRRDLESPVHRAGMHHHAIGPEGGESSRVEAPPTGILPFSREIRGAHPLELDAQHHERVGFVRDRLVEVVTARARATPRRRWGRASAARRG